MKTTISGIILISALSLFQRCTLPEIKQARFEKDVKEVINELKLLKDFEDAQIESNSTSLANKTVNTIKVQLLNGKGLPDNTAELRDLGKEAMHIVSNSIENEKDYDNFQVVFVQNENTGPATTSFTRPFNYSLEELK